MAVSSTPLLVRLLHVRRLREGSVTEADYWAQLERRVCRELAGMEENALRFLWCDGFIPEEYAFNDAIARITGRAWICNGPQQEQWEFTLIFDRAVGAREDIPWEALLPPDEVRGWLALDRSERRIRIRPSRLIDA